MKFFKKSAALLVAASIVAVNNFGFIPSDIYNVPIVSANFVPVPIVIDSGQCGADESNVEWRLDGVGTLTFSGEGEMADWEKAASVPWSRYAETHIKKVVIQDGVKNFGDYAFNSCSLMSEIIISDRIHTIGSYSMQNCDNLTSVTIPEGVTEIGEYAFYGCNSLTSIDVAEDNPNYCSVDGVLFNKKKNRIIQYPIGKNASSYSTLHGVTTFSAGSFADCDALTDITFSDSVETFDNDAFSDCDGLTEIIIPESVTKLLYGAFGGCDNLTDITIKNSACSITNNWNEFITIPKETVIHGYKDSTAQLYAQTYGNVFVVINDEIPTTTTTTTTTATTTTTTTKNTSPTTTTVSTTRPNVNGLEYRIEKDDTVTITGYIESASYIEIPSVIEGKPVTSIGRSAFEENMIVKEVVLPETITTIYYSAFSNCKNLEKINFPKV